MNASRIVVTGLLCALSFAAVPATARAKLRIQPKHSFVSVSMPETPRKETKVRSTIVGDITHHTAQADLDDASFSITATKLPGFVRTVSTDRSLLRKARRELISHFDGKRGSWTKCSFRGHTCRQAKYRTADGRRGIAKFIINDDVMVVVNAVYEEDSDAVKAFFRSIS